jgi:hypothetical protein
MSPARIISEADRAALRRAVPAAMKAAGATAREFSELTGYDAGTLSRCLNQTNPAHTDHFLPVDRAVEIDLWLGRPVMVTAMARLIGCAVFPLPEVDASAGGASAIAASIKELGEALAKIGQELGDDGRIDDRDDVDGLIDELGEAVDAIARLLSYLQEMRTRTGAGAS